MQPRLFVDAILNNFPAWEHFCEKLQVDYTPSTSNCTASRSAMASYVRKSYLVAYNAASAVAWATVLGRVIAVFCLRGPVLVPVSVDNFVRNTQTFAALEMVHSLLGMCIYS